MPASTRRAAATCSRAEPQTFFHSGTNGRWREVLTAEDCRSYEEIAERRLGAECARWLAEGGAGASLAAARSGFS